MLRTPLCSAGKQSTKLNQPSACGLFRLLTHLSDLTVGPYAGSSELSNSPNISSSKKKFCTFLRAPPPLLKIVQKSLPIMLFLHFEEGGPPLLSELCKPVIYFAQNQKGVPRGGI